MTAPSVDRVTPPLRLGPTIRAVDLHACGEPGRVIVGGVEDVPGATMFDKMTWLQANRDDLRLGCSASRAASPPRTATSSCRRPTRRPRPAT